MNDKNRSKLNKVVEILKNLHFNPENIMVTGSIALDLQGVLPKNRISHDVDLILKADNQTWNSLKLIEAICADDSIEKTLDNEYTDRHNTIILKSPSVVINIWKYDGEWSSIKDCETGVYVATVDHIIKTKKMYGRPKDYQDINEICKNIL